MAFTCEKKKCCFVVQFRRLRESLDANYEQIELLKATVADQGFYWCEVNYKGVDHVSEQKLLKYEGKN